jgi:hypothetical protein
LEPWHHYVKKCGLACQMMKGTQPSYSYESEPLMPATSHLNEAIHDHSATSWLLTIWRDSSRTQQSQSSQENHSADPWIHAQNKCCFKLLEGKVVYYARKANWYKSLFNKLGES